jgi:hypothetical protein
VSWKLEDEIAKWSSAGYRLQVDTRRPFAGVTDIYSGGVFLKGLQPFQLTPSPASIDGAEPVTESYIRGNDLIAVYGMASGRTASPQITWSVREQRPALLMDIIISMQTPLLASDPSLSSTTSVVADETLVATISRERLHFVPANQADEALSGVFLFRLADTNLSYVEAIYPSDFVPTEVNVQAETLSYRIICESLEKGVIRKARLRGMIVARDHDMATAIEAYESMLAAEPPLTT